MVSRVRVVAATVVVLLVAGLASAAGQEAPPSGFADTAGNAHEANIDYVVWWGIAQGVTATEYRPGDPVTRAQMGSFLARMIGHGPNPLPDNPPSAFDDTAGSPHAANIDALAAAGIVRGIADRTYGPHLTVTREQMTSFLVRAWEYATGEPLAASGDRFTDIASSAHRDNINKAAEAGFASGTTATTFSPSLPVRRDQMASFIARTVRRMVDHGHATHPDDATPPPEPVERAWWRSLGVVVDAEDFGVSDPDGDIGVSDIKVAQRPDGTYVAVVASHDSEAAWFHVIESTNLVAWTELARFDMQPALASGFYIGSLLALPDGTLKMFGVSDGDGDPVVSSTSTDGGRTWSADPGPLLTTDDFDHEVRLTTTALLERPEGGWRMYVNANECDRPNAMGGDNCPDDEPLMTWELGSESIFSAVSDDLATWTLEPGVRFRASRENGSMNHLDAWLGDDGRVRLTGYMRWSPVSHWHSEEFRPWGHALGELVSDDGLSFDSAELHHIALTVADPQVVRAPDGELRMLAGAQGEVLTDQRGQIRLLERTTIAWEVDPVVPLPVAWQVPPAEEPNDPALFCFPIEVRGSGTLQVEVRAGGWPWAPGSSPSELWDVSVGTLTVPGTIHVKRQDIFDHPETTWATYVVLTDAHGTSWFVPPFGHAEHGFPGEVHGHDFDSFPCPP